MLEALESGKDDENANDENPPQEQAGGPQQAGPDGEMITLIAQLKIIRSLQVDLIDRVELIRSRTGNDESKLTDEDVNELASIAEEQEQLADLVREMTSFFGDPDIPPDADGGVPDGLNKEPAESALPVNTTAPSSWIRKNSGDLGRQR